MKRLSAWEYAVASNPASVLARTVLNKQEINEALIDPAIAHRDLHVFNTMISNEAAKVVSAFGSQTVLR